VCVSILAKVCVKLDTTKRPTNFMIMCYSNTLNLKRTQKAGDVVRMNDSRIPKKLQDILD
jgi:hypothetical protein